jgi:hypothetical protein
MNTKANPKKEERCQTSEEEIERDMRLEQVGGLGHEVEKKLHDDQQQYKSSAIMKCSRTETCYYFKKV